MPGQPAGWGQPQGGMAPQAGMGGPQFGAAAMPGNEVRFSYGGTGGELFGELIVGAILTMITFGIYFPWFICKMSRYMSSKTNMGPTQKGHLQFQFNGEGGSLFGLFIVNQLLTMITFGIYMPWAICKYAKWGAEHAVAVAPDGSQYKLRFNGEGGDLFGTFIVGYLLTAITFGIYMPWFMCKLRKWFYTNTQIEENGQPIGQLDFVGEGGELFGKFIGGYILTMITFGIYFAWFKCNLDRFWAQNTRVNVRGQIWTSDFTGQGGDLFVINLVGGILTGLTFGIYFFWFQTKLIKFNFENTLYRRMA
jgi:uncharacterized membrane protein YjgN (DUF898 family)